MGSFQAEKGTFCVPHEHPFVYLSLSTYMHTYILILIYQTCFQLLSLYPTIQAFLKLQNIKSQSREDKFKWLDINLQLQGQIQNCKKLQFIFLLFYFVAEKKKRDEKSENWANVLTLYLAILLIYSVFFFSELEEKKSELWNDCIYINCH